jgi:hypothetical protein
MKPITTIEEAFKEIRKNGYALKYVSEVLKTPELCKLAVKQDGLALIYVPEALKTPELCKIAAKNYGYALEDVPENLKTPELCKIAVEENEWALKYVPEALKAPKLCKLAVEKNGKALKYVPKALKTSELCKFAVKQDERALQFVPDQKAFLTMYPEFLPIYFKITDRDEQDPDLISLLIRTANNRDIDNLVTIVGYGLNLNLVNEKDLIFLVGCQNPIITAFLDKKFKTKGT